MPTKTLLPASIIISMIAVPLLQVVHTDNALTHELATAAGGVAIAGLLCVCCVWRALGRGGLGLVGISTLDLLVAGYLLYGAICVLANGSATVEPIVLCRWIAMFCGYCLVRMINRPAAMLWAIVISGLIQSLVAFGQHLHLIRGLNRFFDITGSFGNPGQLGGFLAVALAVSCGLLVQSQQARKWHTVLLVICSVAIGATLVLSDSRAGWLGAVLACVFLIYRCRFPFFTRHKVIVVTILTSMLIAGCIGAYIYKKQSADGRLLIWRVSADMVAEKPLFGHGVASFPQKYMNYQADYFARNPDSKFGMVADDVMFSFNEYVHLAVEQGLVGLALLSILLSYAFFETKRDSRSDTFRAGLIALAVFSFFSYPAAIFPLLFLYAILLGNLECKTLFQVMIPHRGTGVLAIIPAAALLFSAGTYNQYKRATILMKQSFHKDSTAITELTHSRMIYNPIVNDIYLLICSQNEIDIDKSVPIFPSTRSYSTLGQQFAANGRYSQAEEYLKSVVNMVPHLMKPRYQLWQLYLQNQDMTSAINMAKYILNQQIKIENTFTLRTREQARLWLEGMEVLVH